MDGRTDGRTGKTISLCMHSMLTCDKNGHMTADIVDFYPRDVVSGVFAYGDVAGWVAACLSVTAGIIISKQIDLS